jgi:hypothetical protein
MSRPSIGVGTTPEPSVPKPDSCYTYGAHHVQPSVVVQVTHVNRRDEANRLCYHRARSKLQRSGGAGAGVAPPVRANSSFPRATVPCKTTRKAQGMTGE